MERKSNSQAFARKLFLILRTVFVYIHPSQHVHIAYLIFQLGLLRRLHTFCLTEIVTPAHPEPIVNDILIRRLAILSQLAVFKDIIPGYRIRALTDAEKAEKVSQMVGRSRDWEQGLVGVYQQYLRVLESELKSQYAPLTRITLRSD